MDGLAYHPMAVWWNNFIGQSVWGELFSLIPVAVLLFISFLLLPKLTKFVFKVFLIALTGVAIIVAVVLFNPFGVGDTVLGFL